jgi:hypothetical protein
MAKKLKGSLVPEGVDYEQWVATASVKDLVAEMAFQNAKLTKVLEKHGISEKPTKKNDRKR